MTGVNFLKMHIYLSGVYLTLNIDDVMKKAHQRYSKENDISGFYENDSNEHALLLYEISRLPLKDSLKDIVMSMRQRKNSAQTIWIYVDKTGFVISAKTQNDSLFFEQFVTTEKFGAERLYESENYSDTIDGIADEIEDLRNHLTLISNEFWKIEQR